MSQDPIRIPALKMYKRLINLKFYTQITDTNSIVIKG